MTPQLQVRANGGWLTALVDRPEARVRLVCFPYAGAGPQQFRLWPDKLPNAELWAVELPGRGRRLRQSPLRDADVVAQTLAREIASLADRPIAFFGHSVGALIAYQTARQLPPAAAASLERVIVSGHRAPHVPLRRPPLHDLPRDDFLRELGRLGGTPHEILASDELMTALLPALRADVALSEVYEHVAADPLECALSAFGGLEDQHVSRPDLVAWRVHAGSEFSLRLLPGDHFFVESQRAAMLDLIHRALQ